MDLPERFSNLPAYAFPRLRALLDSHPAGGNVLHMSIGEPKHKFPKFIEEVLLKNIQDFNRYPSNDGSSELLNAISEWINKRYGVVVNSESEILSLNGTREGLFNAQIALSPETKNGKPTKVLIPNPFYQVYAVGAATVSAEPIFVPAYAENNFMPNYAELPKEILDQTSILFLCSPANPQGTMASYDYWVEIMGLAEKHDFKIFADECYSEIYRNSAPVGALQVAHNIGADPERLVVFHSLSKRSNLPGLRSGFAASGPKNIKEMKQLRNYSGAPNPTPLQAVAAAVWSDENHVFENRKLYQKKYQIADDIFKNIKGYNAPQAGFFLWLPVENDEQATLNLWQQSGIRVLPGSYLSRNVDNKNPGEKYIRVAMVAPFGETKLGLQTIKDNLYTL
jgi:aspartate/methionine/tyrosine aminotransferase